MRHLTGTNFCCICLWNPRTLILLLCDRGICERRRPIRLEDVTMTPRLTLRITLCAMVEWMFGPDFVRSNRGFGWLRSMEVACWNSVSYGASSYYDRFTAWSTRVSTLRPNRGPSSVLRAGGKSPTYLVLPSFWIAYRYMSCSCYEIGYSLWAYYRCY